MNKNIFQATKKIKRSILNLPEEIRELIFLYLDYDDITSLTLTTKKLLHYFNNEFFWKNKIKYDFPSYILNKEKNIKAQYQLLLSDKLAKIYNQQYNEIILNKGLRNKILRLTHLARIKIPIITSYKYIELIMDIKEEDPIVDKLSTLGYKRRNVIPALMFEEFCKGFGFMKSETKLNYGNIVGFTIDYDVPPLIIGYVFSHNNRLYVNWETDGYYDDLCKWPMELERDLCSNGNRLKELYPTLKIGLSRCIDFKDKKNKKYNEEFL